jgi:hypothetical protein
MELACAKHCDPSGVLRDEILLANAGRCREQIDHPRVESFLGFDGASKR